MPRLVAALALALALSMSIAATLADDPAALPVRYGEYKKLNFWRELKLGTAPYVNPALAGSAAVVYWYEFDAAIEALGINRLEELYSSGVIGVAHFDDGSYDVMPLDKVKIDAIVRDPEAARGFVLVSGSKTLSGVEPEGQLVTWQAGPPVSPRR